jgi:hypothetical protein
MANIRKSGGRVKQMTQQSKRFVSLPNDNTITRNMIQDNVVNNEKLSSDIKKTANSTFYDRSDFPKVKSATDRDILVLPDYVSVVINGSLYTLLSSLEIDLSASASWDDLTTDWTVAANRAGLDFYLYACEPTSTTTVPDFLLSANSTFPVGYTSDNSRKIGGFHCLCVSAGVTTTNLYAYENEGKDADYIDAQLYEGSTITTGSTAHWLSGWVAGDILPFSCWDLKHKVNDNADQEGCVYDPKGGVWVWIYLASWNAVSTKLESVNGATIADGDSAVKFHWYRFGQCFYNQGARMPRQEEFVSFSLGCPQGTNIFGSADPVTTTGHVDTASKRILSLIGCEDCVGVLFQWGIDSGTSSAAAWSNAYDANDKNVAGQEYSNLLRARFGGDWSSGVICGSRSSRVDDSGLPLYSTRSVRAIITSKGIK